MVKYTQGKKKLESCEEEREAKKKERSLGYVESMDERKERNGDDGWMERRKEGRISGGKKKVSMKGRKERKKGG